LGVVAKKNGLASYEEYKTIRANVLQVFSGYDWTKGHYVGREQLIRIRVAGQGGSEPVRSGEAGEDRLSQCSATVYAAGSQVQG